MVDFPKHGEVAAGTEPNDKEEEKKTEQKPTGKTVEERLHDLELENARLSGELSARGRQQEPVKKAAEPEPEPDWEKLLFEEPKEAVKMIKASVRKDVEAELTGKYEADQGTRTFWSEFYTKNDDLKDDQDMVDAVLRANMKTLGDMPVSQAQEKLADLTRERIMKYTGKKKEPGGKKATVEGESQITPKAEEKKDDRPTTLSDLIRARRVKRTQKANAA